jgi:hypothetical protein
MDPSTESVATAITPQSFRLHDMLKTLLFFPIAGFLIKLIMDSATNDSMTATSSIIMNSCIVLYLACLLLALGTLPDGIKQWHPYLSPIAIGSLFGIYIAYIILYSKYYQIINTNLVKWGGIQSVATWLTLLEIAAVGNYVFNLIASENAPKTLVCILILIVLHLMVLIDAYVCMTTRPTDDSRNAKSTAKPTSDASATVVDDTAPSTATA